MRVSETRSSKEKDRVTASSTDTETFHEPNIFLHGSGAAVLNRRTKIGRNTASEGKEVGEWHVPTEGHNGRESKE